MVDIENIRNGLKNISQENEVKNIQERLVLTQIENNAKEHFLNSIKTLREKEGDTLREKFKELDSLIEVLVKSGLNGLIVVSNGGLGKSYKVLKKMNELKSEIAYFSVFSTPLELYHTLFENNGKIIVLDDIEGLLDNVKCVSILKSALWSATGIRILNYKSTSEQLKAPKQFEFTGKLILLTNKIGNDLNLKALVSRVLFCELNFDYKQIVGMMRDIVKKDYDGITLEQREEVMSFIVNLSSPCTVDFNLRTLIKAFEIYKSMPDKWKELVKNMLKDDEVLKIIFELEKDKSMTVKDKIIEFSRISGLSRRTYFAYKKKLGL